MRGLTLISHNLFICDIKPVFVVADNQYLPDLDDDYLNNLQDLVGQVSCESINDHMWFLGEMQPMVYPIPIFHCPSGHHRDD